MPRRFDAGTEKVAMGDNVPINNHSMSGFCWCRPTATTRSDYDARIFCKQDDVGEADHDWMLSTLSATNAVWRVRIFRTTNGNTTVGPTGAAWNTSHWYHVGFIFEGATTHQTIIYEDGSAIKTGSTHLDTSGNIGNRTSHNYEIGNGVNYGNAADMDIAWVTLWNTVLTADEIAALSRGVNPMRMRPASIVSCHPLWAAHTTEIDLKGGLPGTVTGATLTAGGPPVEPYRMRGPSFFDVAAAGGGGLSIPVAMHNYRRRRA